MSTTRPLLVGLAAVAGLLLLPACDGARAPEPPEPPEPPQAGPAIEAPADAAELVTRSRDLVRESTRVFELVEKRGDDVVREGRVTVYPTAAQPVVDLSWSAGEAPARVQSDGETVWVRDDASGDVRYSPWSEAGSPLFGEAAGRLLPAALDPSSFASYGASLEDGPGADIVRAVVTLQGGGGWQVAISRSDGLPRWVSFRASAESPIERLELEAIDAGEEQTEVAFGLTPAEGGETIRYYAGPAPGDAAPDVTFELADGTSVRISDLAGRVVVVDFWATWCAPCRPAMKKLEELYREHREAGLAVYGLRLFDSGDPSEYLESLGISYPTGDGSPFAVPYAVETYGLPTLYVIGRDGAVASLLVGFSEETEAALAAAIESALAG